MWNPCAQMTGQGGHARCVGRMTRHARQGTVGLTARAVQQKSRAGAVLEKGVPRRREGEALTGTEHDDDDRDSDGDPKKSKAVGRKTT